ncbi:MAG: PIN domain-containing protein, partial [Oscillospiraceae bacterium]|nr:PIN domain-containing protein [Oscillospiraceae bacterium]
MRVFLIDFENVHSEGMNGVDHLTDMDEVVIFYSNNADSISFDILHKLMFCKSKLSYYRIKRGGKNALDFQLSCYLGFRIHKDPEAEFYIISKDSGYDFIMDFWDCGYLSTEPKIRRFNNIKTLLQWEDMQNKQKKRALNALQNLAEEPAAVAAASAPVTPKAVTPRAVTPRATTTRATTTRTTAPKRVPAVSGLSELAGLPPLPDLPDISELPEMPDLPPQP